MRSPTANCPHLPTTPTFGRYSEQNDKPSCLDPTTPELDSLTGVNRSNQPPVNFNPPPAGIGAPERRINRPPPKPWCRYCHNSHA